MLDCQACRFVRAGEIPGHEFCREHARELDAIDDLAARTCPECGSVADYDGDPDYPCLRCRADADVVLEVGIDPGTDGAYAWDCEFTCADGPLRMSEVRSIGADERTASGKTKGGKAKVRRLASAECLALELTALLRLLRKLLGGRRLRLVAHLEIPPAAPGQSSSTTASQHRSLGRIEGVLVALGFEVHLTRPPVWRAALGMKKVGDTLGTDDARAKQKLAKEASIVLAASLRPDLGDRIGNDDNRAEAVLVLLAGRKMRLEREAKP